MEYGRDTNPNYQFATPKEPAKPEDLHARGYSRRHRILADGRTVIIKYGDSMRTPRDSRFQQANVPVMTDMYQFIKGKRGKPDAFRKLPSTEFVLARREIEAQYKSAHLGAEDLAGPATGREVNRTIRRPSGL